FLLWTGIAPAQETAMGQPAPGSFEQTLANLPVEALHQVQREDNLHLIAAYYYGDARQWPRVYAANRTLIGANPSVIHRGQVLKILLPAGWAPLEPYDRFVARVRATGIPGLTAPAEAGGGKAEASAPTAAPAAVAPALPEPAPAAPKSY
ncbi:MAG: LysM peptidoglycan-binding domain-containing protein, partial [Candidatus Methylomirabilales bacterium]